MSIGLRRERTKPQKGCAQAHDKLNEKRRDWAELILKCRKIDFLMQRLQFENPMTGRGSLNKVDDYLNLSVKVSQQYKPCQ